MNSTLVTCARCAQILGSNFTKHTCRDIAENNYRKYRMDLLVNELGYSYHEAIWIIGRVD